MSQVYSTEPQTTGHVILHSSHGEIHLFLWCKECPKTCRSFLQLAMDGYYNGLPFHRVIKNYLLQTGDRVGAILEDPVAKSKVASYLHSVCYDKHSRPELSSRIKFNHRGQVAMALNITVTEADIGDSHLLLDGQFFITLDEASHLNGQHVIFATIIGPTIFNAIRASGVELMEEKDSPVDAAATCFVERVEIKDHIFGDEIKQTLKVPWLEMPTIQAKKRDDDIVLARKKKRKGNRDLNVLSFANEETSADYCVQDDTMKKLPAADRLSSKNNDYEKMHLGSVSCAKNRTGAAPLSLIKTNRINAESIAVLDSINDETVKHDFTSSSKLHIAQIASASSLPALSKPVIDTPVKTSCAVTNLQGDERQKQRQEVNFSVVEERRAKYKKFQKGSSTKDDKRKREEDTIQRMIAFKSKILGVDEV
mmetsp:Transcript_10430/g.15058  ORF Transcript_10430/g.15058 Transcript_10430/m.15058 type:complete len:423 (+) Transcript_10430:74-1342(+)